MFVGETATLKHEDWWVAVGCPGCDRPIKLDCAPYGPEPVNVPTERRRTHCPNCSSAIEFAVLQFLGEKVEVRLIGYHSSSRVQRR